MAGGHGDPPIVGAPGRQRQGKLANESVSSVLVSEIRHTETKF